LRTVFPPSVANCASALNELPAEWIEEDLHGQSETAIAQRVAALTAAPFDLALGPLFRLAWLHIGGQDENAEGILLLVAHHIITDGWSDQILARDLALAYAALRAGRHPELPPPPAAIRFRRLATRQLAVPPAPIYAGSAPARPLLQLPTDGARNSGNNGLDRRCDRTPLALTGQAGTDWLASVTAEQRTATLAAALFALLHIESGQTDLVIGLPVAGRERPELQDQVGLHINLLPLRLRLDAQQPLAALLAATTAVLDLRWNAEFFAAWRAISDCPAGRHPVFDDADLPPACCPCSRYRCHGFCRTGPADRPLRSRCRNLPCRRPHRRTLRLHRADADLFSRERAACLPRGWKPSSTPGATAALPLATAHRTHRRLGGNGDGAIRAASFAQVLRSTSVLTISRSLRSRPLRGVRGSGRPSTTSTCAASPAFSSTCRPVAHAAAIAMTRALVHRGRTTRAHVEGAAGWGPAGWPSSIMRPAATSPLQRRPRGRFGLQRRSTTTWPLRGELEARGHRLQSRCDVEVLPHLYEEYGDALPARLSGQFALAVYEPGRHRLLLARDPVGICPLFWCEVAGQILFASEIKALLAHPAVPRRVDLAGLDQVLTLPGLVSPRTLFAGIHALPPGQALIVENGRVRTQIYSDLDYPRDATAPAAAPVDWEAQLEHLLQQAVARRLQADVPVGFYLSGGLDSSLVAALIHRLRPHDDWHAFSIVFDDPALDVRRYQRQMADRIGVRLHQVPFVPDDIERRLRVVVRAAETLLRNLRHLLARPVRGPHAAGC
jgi:hypothetical protein